MDKFELEVMAEKEYFIETDNNPESLFEEYKRFFESEQYQQALACLTQSFKEAEKYYKMAVTQDFPPSMFHLAILLENQHRYEEANELILKSAKFGHIEAIHYNLSLYK